ncbi:MAG: acyl-CoA dehydrogenase family protein [Chloroflexi bacterium]|nr:acyl-CoA dehydrogenase family protein [Chloroflexota bacterium]
MDLRFTPEQERFRNEVSQFLSRELPARWDYTEEEVFNSDDLWQASKEIRKKLAQKGWLTMAWPREYGGQAASHMMQLLFAEQAAYHRTPGLNSQGIGMLAPTLMIHGSEELRREFLPPIARSEVWWCQGYSEPGSGSDLASLQTRAVEDGDDFVINGSKIWTSGAHRSQWMFLLTRTDPDAPKHRGISFLLLDMKSPGITIRPIPNMGGFHSFNQVFFDNVRTPKRYLVGEKNRGWYVGATLLDFERSGVNYSAWSRRTLEEVADYCRSARPDGERLASRAQVRNTLAELSIETEVSRMLAYRVAWMQGQGQVPNKEASISKVFGSELLQRVGSAGLQILGLYAQVSKGDRHAALNGRVQTLYLTSWGRTIGGGASEIQRNIIATRGLGLPRG